MNAQTTISLQEVRKNPLAFLKQLNQGKTVTVIYHSKPYATVVSADTKSSDHFRHSAQRLLGYAQLVRDSASTVLGPTQDYKQLYDETVADKYDFS